MMYAKAVKRIAKSIDEAVPVESIFPWSSIDIEVKKAIIDDGDSMKVIANMSDGLLFSLALSGEVSDQIGADKNLSEEEKDKIVQMGMLEVVSTALLRAFALGVHAQKSISEVEFLESLTGAQ